MSLVLNRSLVLFLVAACAPGCMVGEEAAGVEPGVAEAMDDDPTDDDGSVAAPLYRVPVRGDIAPWATYPVDGVEISRAEESIKIEYTFPLWLVGELQQVELVGRYEAGMSSFAVSAGALGDGECRVTGTRVACTERLPGVIVHREKAEVSMRRAGLSDYDVSQRLRVTDAFSVDPIGIVELDLALRAGQVSDD